MADRIPPRNLQPRAEQPLSAVQKVETHGGRNAKGARVARVTPRPMFSIFGRILSFAVASVRRQKSLAVMRNILRARVEQCEVIDDSLVVGVAPKSLIEFRPRGFEIAAQHIRITFIV
jgi:hypothetical protein